MEKSCIDRPVLDRCLQSGQSCLLELPWVPPFAMLHSQSVSVPETNVLMSHQPTREMQSICLSWPERIGTSASFHCTCSQSEWTKGCSSSIHYLTCVKKHISWLFRGLWASEGVLLPFHTQIWNAETARNLELFEFLGPHLYLALTCTLRLLLTSGQCWACAFTPVIQMYLNGNGS